jgi:hypothetical protein
VLISALRSSMNRSAGSGAVAQAASMADPRSKDVFFMQIDQGLSELWRSDTPVFVERQYEIIENQ